MSPYNMLKTRYGPHAMDTAKELPVGLYKEQKSLTLEGQFITQSKPEAQAAATLFVQGVQGQSPGKTDLHAASRAPLPASASEASALASACEVGCDAEDDVAPPQPASHAALAKATTCSVEGAFTGACVDADELRRANLRTSCAAP